MSEVVTFPAARIVRTLPVEPTIPVSSRLATPACRLDYMIGTLSPADLEALADLVLAFSIESSRYRNDPEKAACLRCVLRDAQAAFEEGVF